MLPLFILFGLEPSLHLAEGCADAAPAGHLVVVGVVLGGDDLDVLRTEFSHSLHQGILHLKVGLKAVQLLLENANLIHSLSDGSEIENNDHTIWKGITSFIVVAKPEM